MRQITPSIIQGSAIEPSSYVVCASDLRPATRGNEMMKFAGDFALSSCLLMLKPDNEKSNMGIMGGEK